MIFLSHDRVLTPEYISFRSGSDNHSHKLYSPINFNLTASNCCWFGTFQSLQCIYICQCVFSGIRIFFAGCQLETLLNNQSLGTIPSPRTACHSNGFRVQIYARGKSKQILL